jgi:hypothetical protein
LRFADFFDLICLKEFSFINFCPIADSKQLPKNLRLTLKLNAERCAPSFTNQSAESLVGAGLALRIMFRVVR